MFEPLLFHLFLLYSSLSLVDGLLKYARSLALGKILFVSFLLFVETFSHVYFCIKIPNTESFTNSLLPVHMMVRTVSADADHLVCLKVLLSCLAVRVLEKTMETLEERSERSDCPLYPGTPPHYIVVEYSWSDLQQVDQSGQEYSQVLTTITPSMNIFPIQINPLSLERLTSKWRCLKTVGRNLKWDLSSKMEREEFYWLNCPLPSLPADRASLTEILSVLSSEEERAGLVYLRAANSLVLILFCVNADYISFVAREMIRTEQMSGIKTIKCGF